ncbi:YT521-B-like domain-containing protein [Russula brevipes]|nr:YT521-B-like domain-containing protein [Russula brevipes]
MAPQNPSPTPHQGVTGSPPRPSDPPSAFAASPPPYQSPPPFRHRVSYAGPQYPLRQAHPSPHVARSPPPFAFPHHPGMPRREAGTHMAYTSPPIMPMLRQHAPVYQLRGNSTDPTPSPRPPYAAGTTSTALPVYPHVSHSSLVPGQISTTVGEVQPPTSYSPPGTYSPVGYATPPSFVYRPPGSFVPAPAIYGSHYPSPHYAQPYASAPELGNQGVWWYLPPGATTAVSSFESHPWSHSQFNSNYPSPGLQHEDTPSQTRTAIQLSAPSPTVKSPSRSRPEGLGDPRAETAPASLPAPSSSNPKAKATEDPPPSESGPDFRERRSYHPKLPAHRSEWVMWAGNVPSDAASDELRDFFNQPSPPRSPSQSQSMDVGSQQVHGGVSSVFLISRSNCAFVNFESEAQLEAATARFHGQAIRPDDLRCPRLVCRIRKKTDDLKAGVGAQRGNAMHVKWVKEQRARVRLELTGSSEAMGGSASPLPTSDDDGQRRPMSSCSTSSCSSRASTDSGVLSRYFPQRYFILKSLTQYDLELSVQKNVWATQHHNEEILDRAYRTSKDVFLIFGVNKSGEFYGYARMAGPVLKSKDRVPWATRPTQTVEGRDSPNVLSPKEHRAVDQSPEAICDSQEGASFVVVQASSAPAELHGPHSKQGYLAQRVSAGPPRASIPLKSFSLNAEAPYYAMRDNPDQCIPQAAHAAIPGERGEVSEHNPDAVLQAVVEEPTKDSDAVKDAMEAWGRPFRVDWIRTEHLPFFRTRHIRNPWNHGREVKVSRDGTELEPNIGRQLLEEWDKPPPSPVAVTSASPTTPRRRGTKSTSQVP